MKSEPTLETLPLAEAMIAWSEPALVEAIRRAEARIPRRTMTQMDRFTLEEVVTQRQAPKRWLFRSMNSNDETRDLDRAWNRLMGSFRLKIEQGIVRLIGTPPGGAASDLRAALSANRAVQFDLDPGSGSVFMGFSEYMGVTASRGTEGTIRGGCPAPEGSKRTRGRPKFPLAEFANLARGRRRASNNKDEASRLLADFTQRYPGEKLPSHRTVLDHVDDIYMEAAAAESALKPSN